MKEYKITPRTLDYLAVCKGDIGLVKTIKSDDFTSDFDVNKCCRFRFPAVASSCDVEIVYIQGNVAAFEIKDGIGGGIYFEFDHVPSIEEVRTARLAYQIETMFGQEAYPEGYTFREKTTHWLDIEGDIWQKWDHLVLENAKEHEGVRISSFYANSLAHSYELELFKYCEARALYDDNERSDFDEMGKEDARTAMIRHQTRAEMFKELFYSSNKYVSADIDDIDKFFKEEYVDITEIDEFFNKEYGYINSHGCFEDL